MMMIMNVGCMVNVGDNDDDVKADNTSDNEDNDDDGNEWRLDGPHHHQGRDQPSLPDSPPCGGDRNAA